jgi:hypothetical protein
MRGCGRILGWVRETSLRVWGPNAAVSRLASLRLTRQFKGLNEGPIWKIVPPPPLLQSYSHTSHTIVLCMYSYPPPRTPKQWMWTFCIHYILLLSNINLDKFIVYRLLYRRKESPHHEMELHLFNKRLESLLHAIRSPFYCGFKENHTLLWFKNPYKKIRETRKPLIYSIHE